MRWQVRDRGHVFWRDQTIYATVVPAFCYLGLRQIGLSHNAAHHLGFSHASPPLFGFDLSCSTASLHMIHRTI